MKFELMEMAGIQSALKGMRYPTKSKGDSKIIDGNFIMGESDKKLAKHLLNKKEKIVVHNPETDEYIFGGDVHGKFQRAIIAWFDIDAPRYIWSELDTYMVGMSPVSSESTMYTLIKECGDITYDMFAEHTPKKMIDAFIETVDDLEEEYGDRKHIPIHILKAALPEGWMQGRVRAYSYQTLRRIHHYRKTHRLPEWQIICDAIENLPFADELIFGK